MFWDDEKEDDRLADNLNKAVESLGSRRFLLLFLFFSTMGNFIVWLCVILFPVTVRDSFNAVHEVSDKISKATLIVPFALAVFSVYSLFRLKFPDIEEQNLESDLMSSYTYQASSLKRWWVWLLSITAGIVNLILLVLTDIFLSSD